MQRSFLHFNIYGGEVQKVTMVFQNRMLSTVLDRFGHSVMASPVDKSHFRITVPVAVSDQFYGWIFGLGNYVTIVGPDSVKEGMKKPWKRSRSDTSKRNKQGFRLHPFDLDFSL